MMLVNVKSDVSGYKRIAFQGCRLYWSILFLMVQLAISIFLYCAVCEKLFCRPVESTRSNLYVMDKWASIMKLKRPLATKVQLPHTPVNWFTHLSGD